MTQGKGSTRRPRAITPEQEAEAWERTFSKPSGKVQGFPDLMGGGNGPSFPCVEASDPDATPTGATQ